MRKLLLVAVVMLGPATLLSACSSSPNGSSASTTTTSAAHASTTAVPNVSQYLLAISDFPTGWSVDNSQKASGACYNGVLKNASPLSFGNVNFVHGGSTPLVGQTLGYYSNGPSAYSKVASSLNACKSFTLTFEGETAKGTMGQLSFPSYGEQSTAYNATIEVRGSVSIRASPLCERGTT
jgi:hypothetical protein